MPIATCPNDPTHNEFDTPAHVMEHWIVDRHGNYLRDSGTGDGQVTHGPDPGNIWTCVTCGATAVVQ